MTDRVKVFRSRISILLIGFSLAILIPVFMHVLKIRAYPGMYVLGISFLLLIFLFTGMRYIVSDGKLLIKIWFINAMNIDIADIRSVKRSYNPLSSPAASLKRLRISIYSKAKYQYVLISPAREQQFLEALKAINPDIVFNVPVKRGIFAIWDWDI